MPLAARNACTRLPLHRSGACAARPQRPRLWPQPSRELAIVASQSGRFDIESNDETASPAKRHEPSSPSQPGEEPSSSSSSSTSSSSQPEEANDGAPRDPRRPMLVRIIVSAFRRIWQSICRALDALPGTNTTRMITFALVFGVFNALFRTASGTPAAASSEVLYSNFIQLTRAGVVHSAVIDDQASVLYFSIDQAKVRAAKAARQRWWQRGANSAQASSQASAQQGSASVSGRGASQQKQQFATYSTRLVERDTSFVQTLIDAGVPFGVRKQTLEGALTKLCTTFVGLWIPLLPIFFVLKRVLDAQSGKSKKAKQSFEPPDTTFADVAGVDAVKVELEEAVACLRDPSRFEALSAKLPSGILLYGPPGTGKTLLARAVAGEAGVPFFAVSASEFVEMFVGRGAARIRELFAQARKAAPAVVFIDELDAVGGKRGLGINDERDQTLNQLLTELDGFEKRPSILLLAATNRPEVLDKALLRPGRISRRVAVPLPDEPGRREIIRVHLRGVPMESGEFKGAAVEYLAALTGGFSGAELFNVVNEGALLAARRGGTHVSLTDLVTGVQRTRYGVNAQPRVVKGLIEWLGSLLPRRDVVPARASPLY